MCCGLLYYHHGFDGCEWLWYMCGGLWGHRDNRQLGRMYGVHGGQLQGKRRQCGMYSVQRGLLLHWDRSYVLQRVRGG